MTREKYLAYLREQVEVSRQLGEIAQDSNDFDKIMRVMEFQFQIAKEFYQVKNGI